MAFEMIDRFVGINIYQGWVMVLGCIYPFLKWYSPYHLKNASRSGISGDVIESGQHPYGLDEQGQIIWHSVTHPCGTCFPFRQLYRR